MATVFVVLSGTRYETTRQLGAYALLDAARLAAIASTVGEEQDPPAEGFVASWIDSDFNFIGIRAVDLL